jgi:Ser/Thr protein kinase RdoA (MazF antagonist)
VIEDALDWAGRVVGEPVVEHVALDGGLTSTMLALTDLAGGEQVLRLMTEEPWRRHGEALTRREHEAQLALRTTGVPAPLSLGLDAAGEVAGVAAHLMTRLPGSAGAPADDARLDAMALMLARIHDVRPERPFRTYQDWASPEKWVVPQWTSHPDSWRRAFGRLAEGPPAYDPVFIHRDFSHRNLLWRGEAISGVVDWVETSTGPAWLDAAHAATNLAIALGTGRARDLVARYAAVEGTRPDPYWLVMDAVAFLPAPGREALFGSPAEQAGIDEWVHHVVDEGGLRRI